MSITRKLAALLTVGVLAVAAPAAASSIHIWDSNQTHGSDASVKVSATITPVPPGNSIHIWVAAKPRQRATITWSISCTDWSYSTIGSQHGAFKAMVGAQRDWYLVIPLANPARCTVNGKATIASGRLTMTILTS